MSDRINKLAVFGNPIAQSKSPVIHQHFAKQCNIALEYTAILGSEDNFEQDLARFFSDEQAIGANITMPFKDRAAKWATNRSDEVSLVGAANTLVRSQGISPSVFTAYTTDGLGLVSDLLRNGMQINQARVLLIGAGGAAKGAVSALLAERPVSLTITNRTSAKANELVQLFVQKENTATDLSARLSANTLPQRPVINAVAMSEVGDATYDLIINATSLSLHKQLPAIDFSVFSKQVAVYDMVYQDQATCFMRKATNAGCQNVSDGLGMLVGQAAESFYLWFGVRPKVEPVLALLRSQL